MLIFKDVLLPLPESLAALVWINKHTFVLFNQSCSKTSQHRTRSCNNSKTKKQKEKRHGQIIPLMVLETSED